MKRKILGVLVGVLMVLGFCVSESFAVVQTTTVSKVLVDQNAAGSFYPPVGQLSVGLDKLIRENYNGPSTGCDGNETDSFDDGTVWPNGESGWFVYTQLSDKTCDDGNYNDNNGDGLPDYHTGEDWNGKGGGNTDLGQSVYPIADGVVIAKGFDSGFGNMVLIVHKTPSGEYVISVYAHLDTIESNISLGQPVYQGQQLGTIGTSGNVTAHLHLELRKQSMLKIEGDDITLRYPADVWPAFPPYEVNGDNGREFIFKNYYDPSDYIKFMVARYAFDSGSTATSGIKDLSVYTNHGTMTGALTWKSGSDCINNGCLEFDGIDDYITVLDSPTLNFGQGDFTIGLWKKGYTNTARLISKRSSNNAGYEIADRNGVVSVFMGDGTTPSHQDVGGTNINDDSWHYIVVTWNGSDNIIQVFLDGNFDGQATYSNTDNIDALNILTIGNYSKDLNIHFFNGLMDEITIYDRILTQQEIQDNFNAFPIPTGEPGVLAQYTFDKVSDNLVPDMSGNGNIGTMFGSPIFKSGDNCINNGCLEFDGIDDYITVLDSPTLNFGQGDFTIGLWKKGYTNTARLISKRSSNNAGYEIIDRNDSISVFMGDGTTLSHQDVGGTNIDDDSWHYIVVTWNGSDNIIQIFLDGNFDGQATYSNIDNVDASNILTIGNSSQNPNTQFFNGLVDEVTIYDRILTDAEILSRYNALNPN